MQNKRRTPIKQYRYPGVTPFATGQRHIFFGRQQEIEALHRLIRREPLVALYSKSGLGKSSLLNAGIVPACIDEGIYTPLVIRSTPASSLPSAQIACTCSTA